MREKSVAVRSIVHEKISRVFIAESRVTSEWTRSILATRSVSETVDLGGPCLYNDCVLQWRPLNVDSLKSGHPV